MWCDGWLVMALVAFGFWALVITGLLVLFRTSDRDVDSGVHKWP
jgi:hypothetical protein